jgi:dTDP-4-amino-4,6-dideoxygalactose transaminase
MSEWIVPLGALNYDKEEEDAVLRVLRTGWISMGPEVQAFEREFAEFQRADHAFAVANGTAALHLALLALGVGSGDEVIQPALNFVAAANMTTAVGATPVFADVNSLDEPTLDPFRVEQLVTPRTKAVIVMHYGGNLCKMPEILNICRERNLYVVEDACHAIGVRDDNAEMAGSIGDIGAFSFFSNKNLATGEGGMVVTGRDDLAERIRLLRSHGMNMLSWDRHKGYANTYDVSIHGYNYRLDEIHAALGREQLKKLHSTNRKRGELTRLYRKLLSNLPDWKIPFANRNNESAFHLMPILAPDVGARDQAVRLLRRCGIQTGVHYPCVTGFSAFEDYKGGPVSNSEEFSRRIITLPLHPKMEESSVIQVTSALSRPTESPC